MTSQALAAGFEALLGKLPPLEGGDELVLREESFGPTALVRKAQGPPLCCVWNGGAVELLDPAKDKKLPGASLLAAPTTLAAALPSDLGPIARTELVAWRPGKRAVLRIEAGGSVHFLKLLDQKSYRRAALAFGSLGDGHGPLRLAKPACMLDEPCGYLVPCVPGTSLRQRLADGGTPPWPLVDAAIEALSSMPAAAELPTFGFADARTAAVKMLTKAAVRFPRCEEIAARVACVPAPQPRRHGLVHGDLHDKQLVRSDDAASLIDLEGMARGECDFDLVNLAEHLRLRSLQQRGTDDGSGDALLDRAGMPTDDRAAWRLCVTARLLGVYAMRPRWAALLRVLLSYLDKLPAL